MMKEDEDSGRKEKRIKKSERKRKGEMRRKEGTL